MKTSIIACIFLLSPIFLLAQTKEKNRREEKDTGDNRTIFLLSPIFLLAQTKELIQETLQIEHDKGRFNGTLLYADGKELIKVNKGYSNFQFQVKINQDTRFPIVSITKLFTSIALL